ncbi:hypothetical protein CY34DRAFT_811685 [Suillus luteus UH-Slu-Lm8-n1]|uniref:Uncharacterized protein n=1 Tax=Suillus luteus UH-Slu-Lm8-n1 TaxID=930992 RepID=A0A0D0AD36_9AGAM|nr:hypothetical protein CY34DRAFT_811685 [Suillus luteus UH-Slu-Lm8-n1]
MQHKNAQPPLPLKLAVELAFLNRDALISFNSTFPCAHSIQSPTGHSHPLAIITKHIGNHSVPYMMRICFTRWEEKGLRTKEVRSA